MTMAELRSLRSVPARRGMRVKVNGKLGTITSNRRKGYIFVRFNWCPKRPLPCHPTWRVMYCVGAEGMPRLTDIQSQILRNLGLGAPPGCRLPGRDLGTHRNAVVTRSLQALRGLGLVDRDDCLTADGSAWLDAERGRSGEDAYEGADNLDLMREVRGDG